MIASSGSPPSLRRPVSKAIAAKNITDDIAHDLKARGGTLGRGDPELIRQVWGEIISKHLLWYDQRP